MADTLDERASLMKDLHEQIKVNQKLTSEMHAANKQMKSMDEAQAYLNR